MKETFKNTASNGYLNKDRFNEALSCLEKFNIKRLRDTPMAERLFLIFDEVEDYFWLKEKNEEERLLKTNPLILLPQDRNGSISYEEYSKGLSSLLSDKENRIMCK